MTADPCRPFREELGALLLGGLAPDESAAVEAHLDGCPDCRAELHLLEPLSELLPMADHERLGEPAPTAPAGLGRRVARKIESERRAERRAQRRRRWRTGIAIGGATATAAAALAIAVISGGSGGSPAQNVAFTGLPNGMAIQASVSPQPWGSQISVDVHGVRPGARCVVWLRRADGSRVPAGSFRYEYGSGETLSAAVRPAAVRSIAVRAGRRGTFTARLPATRA